MTADITVTVRVIAWGVNYYYKCNRRDAMQLIAFVVRDGVTAEIL